MPREVQATIDIEHVDEPDQVDRLKRLLAHAESEHGKRFALVDMGNEKLLITTSQFGNDPSPFELRILAAFAKPWADAHVAYATGVAQAVRELFPDEATRPDVAKEMLGRAYLRATEASFASFDLTTVALATCGVIAREGDDGSIAWTRLGEGAPAPRSEVPHAG